MKQNIYILLIVCGLLGQAANAMDKDRNGCLQKTPPVQEPKENNQNTTYQPTNTLHQTNSGDQTRSAKRNDQIAKHFEIQDK